MDAGYIAAATGLLGALIGSASSIVAMIIQSRVRDRRDRSKQVTDLSLAEFKMHLDMAITGKGPAVLLPVGAYIYNNNLMLEALEAGMLTPERYKEITKLNDALTIAITDVDQERAGQNPKP